VSPDRGLEVLDGLHASGRIGRDDWLRLRAQWHARGTWEDGDAHLHGSPLSDAEYAALRFVCELSDALFGRAPAQLAHAHARRMLARHEGALLARHRRVVATLAGDGA
jgi:hypothetical protein